MKENFLKSINLCFDIPYPERISHFQPTAKSIGLINSILGNENEKSFFIVAPYGSGKSLTAAYLANVIENRNESKTTLKKLADKVKKINSNCGSILTDRVNNNEKGLVIALSGPVNNLPLAIHTSLLDSCKRLGINKKSLDLDKQIDTITDTLSLFRKIEKKAEKHSITNITILWDEFGRHLESIVDTGNSKELDAVQQLAEYVHRSKLNFTLGLMLHQGLLNYAKNVSQTVRNEWKKIEGRFETIQYVDDSKEMYSLISDVIKITNPEVRTYKNLSSYIDLIKQLKIFKDFSDTELFKLLENASPVNPFALFLLPKVSARVAQNERTLFTFINRINSDEEIGIPELFDYFAEGMLSDTGIGGTYKQYIETMSAISKISDDSMCVQILKTACLLSLGVKGERVQVSKLFLSSAVSVDDIKTVNEKIEKLIDKKLLLYRKLSDDISVWHGADVDIRGRLDVEKAKQKINFNLSDFLTEEVPAPQWKPDIYNSKNNIKRYFEGIYLSSEKLEELIKTDVLENLPVSTDGRIYYCVPSSDDDLTKLNKLVSNLIFDNRILFAIPQYFTDLYDIALEVKCMNILMDDAALINEDPLILPEIQQLSDDARSYLQKMVDRIIIPDLKCVNWFSTGKRLNINNKKELKKHLSDLMETAFYRTPNINNELIVRSNPSGVIINARKKLIMGIMERTGEESFGLTGNKPDMSMLRTVFLHTGLYCQSADGRWHWALPDQLTENGVDSKLIFIWKEFQDFLTKSEENQKNFEIFFELLQRPPFGLRKGLFPILLAAALKAFPSALSITKKNQYLGDILPTTIEDICRFPEEFQISVVNMGGGRKEYLEAFHKLFHDESVHLGYEADLIRKCYDAIEIWKSKLPTAALTTKKLSSKALKFQKELKKLTNPVNMLFINLPQRLGHDINELDKLINTLEKCKKELENVSQYYLDQSIESFFSAIQSTKKIDKRKKLRDSAKVWASHFPQLIRSELKEQTAKALLVRIDMGYDSDEKLFNSISNLLLGKNIDQWDDSTVPEFYRKIHTTVDLIEETALNYAESVDDNEIAQKISKLAENRITMLYDKLINIVGKEQTVKIINDIINKSGEIADDDNEGCA